MVRRTGSFQPAMSGRNRSLGRATTTFPSRVINSSRVTDRRVLSVVISQTWNSFWSNCSIKTGKSHKLPIIMGLHSITIITSGLRLMRSSTGVTVLHCWTLTNPLPMVCRPLNKSYNHNVTRTGKNLTPVIRIGSLCSLVFSQWIPLCCKIPQFSRPHSPFGER